ncbi:MAG: hypothetical protein AB7S57_23350 [Acetobacteraceae bacterium]
MPGEPKPHDAGMESVTDILRRHKEIERDYANYWKFRIDRKLEEQHIAACLLAYLEAFEGWTGAKVASSDRDPPDCCGTTGDGKTFGIEVTELVRQKTVKRHQLRRNAEGRGLTPPAKAANRWDMAIWTAEALGSKLAAIIQAKDKPAIGGPFAPYLVAIVTDEGSVTPALVAEALTGFEIECRYIDSAYLLLSYDPRVEDFPNRIPVYKIPVSKVS